MLGGDSDHYIRRRRKRGDQALTAQWMQHEVRFQTPTGLIDLGWWTTDKMLMLLGEGREGQTHPEAGTATASALFPRRPRQS
jgi:hypothetical protein